MKLASGGHLDDLDATSFFAQGQEYDDADLRDSVLKLLLVENRSHPFAVVRATELRRWVDSGDYTRILGGDYPRRAGRRPGHGLRRRAKAAAAATPRRSSRARTRSASSSTTSPACSAA